ncbi:hypothetical protein ACW0TN_05460 [Fusobacterium pseudoperiodonticum]|jgi:hypothetical protein|uniref:Uncharacterized protein n=1 Tax=Fusobacterium pseudoperiodonticum TaxID=2663009 RepID=A0AAD0F200_9FUSO|nr:hypothetical protein [Fusobacterium pseudoperiodonticum]ATV35373.1 hypothetical protein CTM64_04540 [Fusobacterium pseudoperiodonticum]ATV61732.1 hypothetical protein CTM74_07805 [Fusobacterium pseudoperiodonticum]MBF1192354.1 hypothetical protein [Fusobacterium periodonticum]MBF1213841.1 hypothetical protein [Fusobacterium periodonticum]
MRKLILISCFALSALSFAAEKNLPKNVEEKIRYAVSTTSGADRRETYDWYKDSYFEMVERLDKAGIPQTDKEIIIKRLEAMYGANYPKQLARINDEINDYKGLVNRIREEQNTNQQKIEAQNKKSKEEIASILNSSSIPKAELNRIEENAKAEYPDDYTLQKAFIKGAIKTYNDLKK